MIGTEDVDGRCLAWVKTPNYRCCLIAVIELIAVLFPLGFHLGGSMGSGIGIARLIYILSIRPTDKGIARAGEGVAGWQGDLILLIADEQDRNLPAISSNF